MSKFTMLHLFAIAITAACSSTDPAVSDAGTQCDFPASPTLTTVLAVGAPSQCPTTVESIQFAAASSCTPTLSRTACEIDLACGAQEDTRGDTIVIQGTFDQQGTTTTYTGPLEVQLTPSGTTTVVTCDYAATIK